MCDCRHGNALLRRAETLAPCLDYLANPVNHTHPEQAGPIGELRACIGARAVLLGVLARNAPASLPAKAAGYRYLAQFGPACRLEHLPWEGGARSLLAPLVFLLHSIHASGLRGPQRHCAWRARCLVVQRAAGARRAGSELEHCVCRAASVLLHCDEPFSSVILQDARLACMLKETFCYIP